LGDGRLDHPETVPLINDLYREAWGPLHNFFLTSTKQIEKKREGSPVGWVA